jgi:glutathione S-transferase
MTKPYRLHYAPDNASLLVRLVLEELGQPYETVLVDRRARAQKSAKYLEVNPAGLIPALETDAGTIFETGAILLWLADRHGDMAPASASAERAAFLAWLFFVSNTLHINLRMTFYPDQYIETATDALQDGARANVAHSLTLLETQALAGHNWFNAPEPSILDYYVICLMRWAQIYPQGQTGWFDASNWPRLSELAARLEQRAATRTAAEAEGLGPHPFTRPEFPNPPEGTAI